MNTLTDFYIYTYFYCFCDSYSSYSCDGLFFTLKEFPLNISGRADLVVVNSFSFVCLGISCISPSILNDKVVAVLVMIRKE